MFAVQPGDITELIESGQFEEGIELEAKRASGNVPANAWETISAFANSSGGVLVLGLDETEDGWAVTGVANARQRIQELHSMMRNPGKISLEVCRNGDIWSESVEGRDIIVAQIHPASRRHRPVYINGNRDEAFVRRNEGDARCTHGELDRMRRESSPEPFDRHVIPYLNMSDFDQETLDRYRAMSRDRQPNLPHHQRNDKEYLRLIQAWRIDRETGNEGPTAAGILMFGTELAIREIRQNHVIDYRRITADHTPSSRWSDRVRWTGNLFGAWMEIFPRLIRGLPTPFSLAGPQRQDAPAGLESLREALVNLLVHTDYEESSDATIFHRDDGYTFRNPGDSWVDPEDLGIQSRSERRNPVIAQLFDNIGLADQAGSGFTRIYDEWQALGFRRPVVESDTSRYEFVLEMSLANMLSTRDREWLTSLGGPWRREEGLALVFAYHQGRIDNQTLRSVAGQHVLGASRTLTSLRDRGYLSSHGSGRNVWYELDTNMRQAFGDGQGGGDRDQTRPNTDQSGGSTDQSDDQSDATDDQTGTRSLHEEERLRDVAAQVAQTKWLQADDVKDIIVELCAIQTLSTEDLVHLLNRSKVSVRRYISQLVRAGRIQPIHEAQQHPDQRYRATRRTGVDVLQQEMDLE